MPQGFSLQMASCRSSTPIFGLITLVFHPFYEQKYRCSLIVVCCFLDEEFSPRLALEPGLQGILWNFLWLRQVQGYVFEKLFSENLIGDPENKKRSSFAERGQAAAKLSAFWPVNGRSVFF